MQIKGKNHPADLIYYQNRLFQTPRNPSHQPRGNSTGELESKYRAMISAANEELPGAVVEINSRSSRRTKKSTAKIPTLLIVWSMFVGFILLLQMIVFIVAISILYDTTASLRF